MAQQVCNFKHRFPREVGFNYSLSPFLPPSFFTVLNFDYSMSDENFRFSRCQRRDCLNITIINDCNLEDKEYFTVSLERGRGVNSKFELANLERNVSITDMDGNTVLSYIHCRQIQAKM